MEKKDAQEFRRRWQAVEKAQREEERLASIELRWRQLNAAYRLSKTLNLSYDQRDDMRGYERWAKLKETLGRTNKA